MLKYFLAVAKTGNMTKAAQYLHLTQPTLSRQIMQLEEELGVSLLDRKENLALTEHGRMMKKRAEEILSLVDKTKEEFATMLQKLSGTIRIGCGEFTSALSLANVLNDFQHQYDHVYIEMYTADPDTLLQKLIHNELDIICSLKPASLQALQTLPLPWHEQLGIFLAANDTLAQHPVIMAADLSTRPLVGLASQLEQDIVFNWLPETSQPLSYIGQSNTLYTRMLLGTDRQRLIFAYKPLPQPTICPPYPMQWKPLSPSCNVPLYLIWKKDDALTDVVKSCISYVKDAISNNFV